MNGHDDTDGFLRQVRIRPLNGDEIRLLGFMLTKSEFEAVLRLQDLNWMRSAREAIVEERSGRRPN